MDISTRFALFQALIILPFAAGMVVKRLLRLENPSVFTRKLIRVNLMAIEPVIALWSTWGLVLTKELAMLPLSGLALVCAGTIFGYSFRNRLKLTPKKETTFLISSSLANHGFTMGAFLCYLLIGEKGLGLAFVFLSYFMPYIFLVVFPYARMKSTGKGFELGSALDFFLSLQNMPLFAIIASLVLLACGISRPEYNFPVDVFIIVSMGLYYFTLGLNFETPAFFASGKENAALAAIKFLLVPALTMVVLRLVNLDPDIETVIFVQSFMPAAIYSVVSSVLFDLDAGFASNLFVWNSILFLAVILPGLAVFRGFFLGLLV